MVVYLLHWCSLSKTTMILNGLAPVWKYAFGIHIDIGISQLHSRGTLTHTVKPLIISRSLVLSNKLFDDSDVVGASPVGTDPATS